MLTVLITNCLTCNLLLKKVLMIYNERCNSLVLWKGFPETDPNLGRLGVLASNQLSGLAEVTALQNGVIGGLSEACPRGARRLFVKYILAFGQTHFSRWTGNTI
jgi:hypothetical protein